MHLTIITFICILFLIICFPLAITEKVTTVGTFFLPCKRNHKTKKNIRRIINLKDGIIPGGVDQFLAMCGIQLSNAVGPKLID